VHGHEAAPEDEARDGAARRAQGVGDEQPGGGAGAIDNGVGRADVAGGGGGGAVGAAGAGDAAFGEALGGVDPQAGRAGPEFFGARGETNIRGPLST